MLRQFIGYSEPRQFELSVPNKHPRIQFPNIWDVASFILVIVALLLWATSLDQINMRAMDDLGLISVLPAAVLIALFILNASFCLAISRRILSMPLLLLHIGVLVLMLYGITAIVQEVPRFAIGWKLAGIIDYVMQNGSVDGKIDAFFNWPAFFILMAFVTQIMGFDSAIAFMGWAPVFFNLLYLGPLWMIFSAATTDKRLVVLGVWFFYLANWIGQDYLAPQAFNYFFFLTIVAVILTYLRGPAWQPEPVVRRIRNFSPLANRLVSKVEVWVQGEEQPVAPSTPGQRAAAVGIIMIIFIAMVSSHQLTPFATLAALGALIFFNRCTALTLPLMLGVLASTWIIYMATPYLAGHMENISSPVGSVGSNIDANLTGRFRGSPGHIFINYTRTGMTLFIWGLAFLGGLRRFRNGYRDWGQTIVALTPFPLLLLQAYGGELLLRIYLFSIPFMAFFVAALFYPSPTVGKRWLSNFSLLVVSLTLLVGFLFTRYGNERMMYFTPEEVSAVQYLYDTAEPGSQLVAATGTLPWRFQDYRTYKYTTIPRVARANDIDALVGTMADRRYPASFLILTRSQKASGELFIGWQPGVWEEFEQTIRDSGRFTSVYANEDAEVFVLTSLCERAGIGQRICGESAINMAELPQINTDQLPKMNTAEPPQGNDPQLPQQKTVRLPVIFRP